MTGPSPHQLRISARNATYPNRAAEDEAVAATDNVVFDRVRDHERHLVANAEQYLSDADDVETAAADTIKALRPTSATGWQRSDRPRSSPPGTRTSAGRLSSPRPGSAVRTPQPTDRPSS